jgi:hypothetical protein
MLRVPVRVPFAAGLKVTLTVHDAPPFSDVPHVFVCVKSVALVPLNVSVPIEIAAVLSFVTVTV